MLIIRDNKRSITCSMYIYTYVTHNDPSCKHLIIVSSSTYFVFVYNPLKMTDNCQNVLKYTTII